MEGAGKEIKDKRREYRMRQRKEMRRKEDERGMKKACKCWEKSRRREEKVVKKRRGNKRKEG